MFDIEGAADGLEKCIREVYRNTCRYAGYREGEGIPIVDHLHVPTPTITVHRHLECECGFRDVVHAPRYRRPIPSQARAHARKATS